MLTAKQIELIKNANELDWTYYHEGLDPDDHWYIAETPALKKEKVFVEYHSDGNIYAYDQDDRYDLYKLLSKEDYKPFQDIHNALDWTDKGWDNDVKHPFKRYGDLFISCATINDIKDMWIADDREGEWNKRSDIEDYRVCMEIEDGFDDEDTNIKGVWKTNNNQ